MFGFTLELTKLILSIAAIFAGIAVITSKNPVISILNLIILYILVAFYLINIGLAYIGISYIIIYVGAIAILFLFIIMMIDIEVVPSTNTTRSTTPIIVYLFAFFIFLFNLFVGYLGYIVLKYSSFYKIQKIYLELTNLDDQLSASNISKNSLDSNVEKYLDNLEDSNEVSILNFNYDEEKESIKDNVLVTLKKVNGVNTINDNVVDSIATKNQNLDLAIGKLHFNHNNINIKEVLEITSNSFNSLYYSVIIPTWESMLGNITQVAAISENLYSTYSSFLYILSVLLLLGMIGAIILTGTDSHEVKVVTIFKDNKIGNDSSISIVKGIRDDKKHQWSYQLIGLSYLNENSTFNNYSSYFDQFTPFITKILIHKDLILFGIIVIFSILFLSWGLYLVIQYKLKKKKTSSTHQEESMSSDYSTWDMPLRDELRGGPDEVWRRRWGWYPPEEIEIEHEDDLDRPQRTRTEPSDDESSDDGADDASNGTGGDGNGGGAGNNGNGDGAGNNGNGDGSGNNGGNNTGNGTEGNGDGSGNNESGDGSGNNESGNGSGNNGNGNGSENNGSGNGSDNNESGDGSNNNGSNEESGDNVSEDGSETCVGDDDNYSIGGDTCVDGEDFYDNFEGEQPVTISEREIELRSEWDNAIRQAQVTRPDVPQDTDAALQRVWNSIDNTVPQGSPSSVRENYISSMLDTFRQTYGLNENATTSGTDTSNGTGTNGGTSTNGGGTGSNRSVVYAFFIEDYDNYLRFISSNENYGLKYLINFNLYILNKLGWLFLSLSIGFLAFYFFFILIYIWSEMNINGKIKLFSNVKESHYTDIYAWNPKEFILLNNKGKKKKKNKKHKKGDSQKSGEHEGSPSGERQEPGSPSGQRPGSSSSQQPSSPSGQGQQPLSLSTEQPGSGSPSVQQPDSPRRNPANALKGSANNPEGANSSSPSTFENPSYSEKLVKQTPREPSRLLKKHMIEVQIEKLEIQRRFPGARLPEVNDTWETYIKERPDWTNEECIEDLNSVIKTLRTKKAELIKLEETAQELAKQSGRGPTRSIIFLPFSFDVDSIVSSISSIWTYWLNKLTNLYFDDCILFVSGESSELFSLRWICVISLGLVCFLYKIFAIKVNQGENSIGFTKVDSISYIKRITAISWPVMWINSDKSDKSVSPDEIMDLSKFSTSIDKWLEFHRVSEKADSLDTFEDLYSYSPEFELLYGWDSLGPWDYLVVFSCFVISCAVFWIILKVLYFPINLLLNKINISYVKSRYSLYIVIQLGSWVILKIDIQKLRRPWINLNKDGYKTMKLNKIFNWIYVWQDENSWKKEDLSRKSELQYIALVSKEKKRSLSLLKALNKTGFYQVQLKKYIKVLELKAQRLYEELAKHRKLSNIRLNKKIERKKRLILKNIGSKISFMPVFFGDNSASASNLGQTILGVVYFAIAVNIVSALLYDINKIISVKNSYVAKGGGFECGFTGFLQTRERYNVVFYKVGILFLMFDLEIFVTFPFPIGATKAQIINKLSILAFLYVLMFGLSIELKKKAIDFEKLWKYIQMKIRELSQLAF
jgi:NADH:ubiquinone oxidoreductase subunit 6 (subunit J)/NADH:ubiquinone oxidoreductase subunit 3 (subunit A)